MIVIQKKSKNQSSKLSLYYSNLKYPQNPDFFLTRSKKLWNPDFLRQFSIIILTFPFFPDFALKSCLFLTFLTTGHPADRHVFTHFDPRFPPIFPHSDTRLVGNFSKSSNMTQWVLYSYNAIYFQPVSNINGRKIRLPRSVSRLVK